MIDRGTRVAIRRGSAKTNSEHEQSDACREVDTLFSKAGPAPDRYLCVHFFLDAGTDFIDVSLWLDRIASLHKRISR
jgi:hypothetical protein